MAQNRAMIDAVPEEHQAEGFALAVYASAIGGACGGLAGGLALDWLKLSAGSWDPRLLYLAGVQVAFIGVWYLSTYLVSHRQQASVRSLVRPLLRAGK